MNRLNPIDRGITYFIAFLLILALPIQTSAESAPANITLTKQAQEAASLLGMESQVQRFIELKNRQGETLNREAMQLQLAIIRKIMTAGLELRKTSAKLDKEITIERQAVDKLTSDRDFIVAATTNANFLQLSILSIIIDGPLEETHNSRTAYHGNVLNIVSGLTVGGLAALTVLEQRGGTRKSPASPNMLGQPLGLDPPNDEKLPPMLWTYLNSVSPSSDQQLTRRERLIEYWRTNKILSIDIDKPATVEKVAVMGPHHHKSSETIKLINNRVTMLFDLRAMIDLLNTGLVELLEAFD